MNAIRSLTGLSLRIAHFTSSLQEPLGGAEQYCLRLVEHQASQGHDCSVITSWASAEVVDRLASLETPVTVIPVWRPFPPGERRKGIARIAFHLMDLVASQRPPRRLAKAFREYDVVHVHRFQGVGTGVLRGADTTVVHTVHDFCLVDTDATSTGAEDRRFPASVLRRARVRASNRVLRGGAKIIFPSTRTEQRNYTLGLNSIPSRMSVVPHGWAVSRSPGTDRPPASACPRPRETVTFLFLGKLTAAKGLPVLLDAWKQGVPGARLLLAGAGPLEQACVTVAQDDPTIEFLGWLDDEGRSAALEGADVLVLPSLWPENFPLVVAEAILTGLPVVTTHTASPPLVVHGETGLVAGADDSQALHEELLRVASDPDLLNALRAGAQRAATLLDMDAHVDRLFEVYDSAAPGARP